LNEIAQGKRRMNENFDIFELTLRRYHFQFVEMFPVASQTKQKTPISLLIEDPYVRICCKSSFVPRVTAPHSNSSLTGSRPVGPAHRED
jgi:hypothetical protein